MNSKNSNNNNNSERGSTTISTATGQRYHQISVANLFSSQTNSLNSQQNGLLMNSTSSVSASTATTTLLPKTPNLSTSSSNSNGSKNYRFDEMVLGTGEPINLQQIIVPCNISKRYVTDDGLFIPCIDYELRRKVIKNLNFIISNIN